MASEVEVPLGVQLCESRGESSHDLAAEGCGLSHQGGDRLEGGHRPLQRARGGDEPSQQCDELFESSAVGLERGQLPTGDGEGLPGNGKQGLAELVHALPTRAGDLHLGGDDRHLCGQGVELGLDGGKGFERRGHELVSKILPAIDMCAGSGSGLPGSRTFQ